MNKSMVISRDVSDIHVVFDKYDKLSIKGEEKREKSRITKIDETSCTAANACPQKVVDLSAR